mmetsp:Transcript_16030/g.32861  ORF Transcript_16030/g.32861 Transcript_16030/m.32861 type:complete len:590 (+) Transcript_16030:20-1789(+)
MKSHPYSIIIVLLLTTLFSTTSTLHLQPSKTSLRVPPLSSTAASLSPLPPSKIYDVVIFGSGPTSLSLASLLLSSPSPPTVAICSGKYDDEWIPNYGTWTHEWERLDAIYGERGVEGLMENGVDTKWESTDCYFAESIPDTSSRLDVSTPYLRLSRNGLKSTFTNTIKSSPSCTIIKSDHACTSLSPNVHSPPCSYAPNHTTVPLKDGTSVRGRIVIDGCGAESTLTIRNDRSNEGYQIAYGVECEVKGDRVDERMAGEYRKDRMTLFDYRRGWEEDEERRKSMEDSPTFMYVMPLGGDRVFFEETSLVANPAVSFKVCKDRCERRLKSMGVEIGKVHEEEFCYIPMGGSIPIPGQRIVPIGAAAGIVHPSTGYQVARSMSCNLEYSDAILKEIEKGGWEDSDIASARINDAVWTKEAVRQRNFAVFGGDFLMNQKIDGLQGFFSGFFALSFPMWSGFLAGMKNLPNYEKHSTWYARLLFGVTFLTKLPPAVGLALVTSIVTYTVKNGPELIQSVTPFAGEPGTFLDSMAFRGDEGDVNAKNEAREMCECKDRGPSEGGEDVDEGGGERNSWYDRTSGDVSWYDSGIRL